MGPRGSALGMAWTSQMRPASRRKSGCGTVGKWLVWECMPEWQPKKRVSSLGSRKASGSQQGCLTEPKERVSPLGSRKASGSQQDCLTEPKERVSPLGALPGLLRLRESQARASQASLPESHSRPRGGSRREASSPPQTHRSSKA